MTMQQRRLATYSVLIIGLAFVIAAFEPHRHVLAAVWPYMTAFWDYYIAF